MNIKNIKKLKEIEAYPKWYLERGGHNSIMEDMEDDPNTEHDERAGCMPYNSYFIPSIEDMCVMFSDYSNEGEIAVKIEAEFSPLGTMFYTVTVKITAQDTVEKTFTEPFLDDALATALIALKENSIAKQEMYKNMDGVG